LDDCLEIRNANFTGPTDHVRRLAIRESSKFGNSTAYIDQVIGYDCIRVPEDFPTIQQGIDAAAPGQGVYVSPDRTYFESIVINKTLELIGGNDSMHAVIDGHFNSAQALNGISIVGPNATDIQVHGFIIRNSDADGIFLSGSSIRIYDNVVDNSRGDGVHVAGPKNSVQNNTVTRSLKCGVYLESSNCTVKQNIIRLNLWGVRCENDTKTKDNIIYQNLFVGKRARE
jgi:parallel beta-helix repeat protein